MKWYQLDKKEVNGETWEKYRTEKTSAVFPVCVVYKQSSDCHWAVYGRSGWDEIAEGRHEDLTTAQMQAEQALKKWIKENE